METNYVKALLEMSDNELCVELANVQFEEFRKKLKQALELQDRDTRHDCAEIVNTTPESIRVFSELMKRENPWVNIKKGDLYHVSTVRMDCTNARDGIPVVVYESYDFKTCGFTRDYEEFIEKFKPADQ